MIKGCTSTFPWGILQQLEFVPKGFKVILMPLERALNWEEMKPYPLSYTFQTVKTREL